MFLIMKTQTRLRGHINDKYFNTGHTKLSSMTQMQSSYIATLPVYWFVVHKV